jgi:hypothetical protein
MFGNGSAVEITETSADAPGHQHLVPLSHLALDLPVPAEGWVEFLARRAIAFIPDDLGRDCVRRHDARRLLDERREQQLRKAKLAKVLEQEAVEADQVRRASIWKGLPADQLPVGVNASAAMLKYAKDSQPKRRTPLEEALSNSGTLTYHPMQSASDEAS